MKASDMLSTELHLIAEVTSASHERIVPVHRGFDAVRQAIAAKQPPPEPTEDSLFDRYTVEDIQRATRESLAPEPGLLTNGYWTLGRTAPRHGTPWASLTLDERSGAVYFRLRIAGTFDEDDDPPRWVACLVNNGDHEAGEVLMNARLTDFWWTVEGAVLRITVVAKGREAFQRITVP